MKAALSWSYSPYRQITGDKNQIYICRLEPSKTRVTVEWLRPDGFNGDFRVCWRIKGGFETAEVPVSATSYTIKGLSAAFDYEIYVTAGELRSAVRLVRPSDVAGKVVNYLHPEDTAYAFSGRYLSSPSIVRCANGDLLASMDVFGKFTPQNLTLIYRSEDNGKTWHYSCELFPCFWGKLFEHRGDIYMLANSNEYGDILIGRSKDNGHSFESPTVLFRSSCSRSEGGLHKNAVPVLEYRGRLWSSIEYGTWEKGGKFHFMMISANADSDLTDARNWCMTEPLVYDHNWPGAAVGLTRGAIEGNAVVSPDGRLCCMLRYEIAKCEPAFGLALLLSADPDQPEAAMKFEKFVGFTGNKSKFDIIRDPQSGRYYSIANRISSVECVNHRNLLSLYVSDDLENWRVLCDLMDYTDRDPREVGLQYVDFLYDGDDILFLCRQGYGGAHSFHDSNYITFHTIKNFRALT